ncbi:hypothetical protein SGLAU_30505 [Streptomyces glaucescens]|uniref:Uncharacterized protein n=1 Tax=Streptomyces glaucescens TaxID=1907 RepID=A0A089XLE3_STRGA|nr:hypothetical protein SGLAU_30505 [Streptomyces glaucescens]
MGENGHSPASTRSARTALTAPPCAPGDAGPHSLPVRLGATARTAEDYDGPGRGMAVFERDLPVTARDR